MASLSRNDFLDVAFNLNEAVLHQNRWEQALQSLADTFNGSFATFELIDKRVGHLIQYHDSSDIEIRDEYISYYMPLNPRMEFGGHPSSPSILHDRLFIDEKDMDRHEFYSDFLKPFDLRYFLSLKAYETKNEVGVFTIQKNATRGSATDDEILAIKRLAPTLKRIAELQVKHGHLFGRLHDLEDVLEVAGEGVLLLDEQGCVNELNSAAVHILKQCDGLCYTAQKVACSDPRWQQKLEQLIVSSISESEPVGGCLLIPRPSGQPPYQLRLQKMGGSERSFEQARSAFVLFIRDPSQNRQMEIVELADGFGLTRAEANVALSVASGNTAQDIATELGVSLPTIRTHIQRIMHKMSANKQVDIARILARYF